MSRALAAALLLSLVTTGCAVRQTYRLVKQGAGSVLIPPGVSRPDVAQRTFTADIAAGHGSCGPAEGAIAIQSRHGRVRITVTRGPLLKQPAGWLSAWTAQAEAQGCIAAGEGLKLAARIVEALPLDPRAAWRLLHANDLQTGYVDLGPETRLQVVSPILREGSPPDAPILDASNLTGEGNRLTLDLNPTPNLVGYETAWYAVQPKSGQIGFAITPLSAERHIQGKVEPAAAPATNHLKFEPQAAYYRLFYKTDQGQVVEVVLAAPTRAELDRQTRKFNSDPALCAQVPTQACVVIPKRVALNPFLVIAVNGSDTMVPVGSTVRAAIHLDRVPPDLKVYKLYAEEPVPVEFDRSSPEILGLVLNGGERISWK
ncbi:MAG: hypothetical protein WBL65_06875 [Bryobacteraceae bacterium]